MATTPGCNLLPSSDINHQLVSLRIAAALLWHAQHQRLGQVLHAPCDVVFSRECVMQPDIVFVREGRSGLIGKMSLRGAPDLIVEILSQNTREKDISTKRKIYSRFEVKEYWIVDPDSETVEVLLWSELGYVSSGVYGKPDCLSSPFLPKLRLPLKRIFEPRIFTDRRGKELC
jgi:Uma2 family endonuclease